MDIIDRAQENDREMQKAIDDYLKRRRTERAQIRGGIAYCLDCGLDIDPARLKAKPDAVRCVECESKKERR